MRKVAELPTRGGFERVSGIRFGFVRVCRFEGLPDSRKFRVYAPNNLKLFVPNFRHDARLFYEFQELFAD